MNSAGYDSFYNGVDPIDGIYCVKCCTGIKTCDIQNGDKGCSYIAPGLYDTTFDKPLPNLPSVGKATESSKNRSISDAPLTDRKSSSTANKLANFIIFALLVVV